jgi:hypothetical protein
MAVFQNQDVGAAILQGAQVLNGALQFQQSMLMKQQQAEENFRLKEENLKQEAQTARLRAQHAQEQLKISQQNALSAQSQAATSASQAATSAAREARLNDPAAIERDIREQEARIDQIKASAERDRMAAQGTSKRVTRSRAEMDSDTEVFMRNWWTTEEAVDALDKELPIPGKDQTAISASELIGRYGPHGFSASALTRQQELLVRQLPDEAQYQAALANPTLPQSAARIKQFEEIQMQITGLETMKTVGTLREMAARITPADQAAGMKLNGRDETYINTIQSHEKQAAKSDTFFQEQGLTGNDQEAMFAQLDKKDYSAFVAQVRAAGAHTSKSELSQWYLGLKRKFGEAWMQKNWNPIMQALYKE